MVSTKLFVLFSCVVTVVIAEPKDHLVGGISSLSGDGLKDAESTLQSSLTKLASGDGPSLKLVKIHSATRQVVSGTLYKYDVDLVDGNQAVKKCNVEIWSQPWLENGIQFTLNCPGEEQVVKRHSA